MNVTYIISDINKALAFEWIATRIDRQRFRLSFILILNGPAELETFLKAHAVPCHCFYYGSKRDLIKILWQVYVLLCKWKPEVVHCHLLYGALIGLTAAKAAGIKKRIYTRHHSDYHQRYFPKGLKWDRWCNRMATGIVAPSAVVKEVLTDLENVPAQKITVIHHGFDLDYFEAVDANAVTALKEKYHVEGAHPVIGVIARFTELKGIQYIIPAFGRLLALYPSAVLLLFNAKGDYEKELKELLKLVPGERYRLIPFERELAAVYRLFHVFVQVSTERTIEAFGQTYVEALAAGVPSVFTLSGIAADFIRHNENALVVPYKDADAIYEAFVRLLQDARLQKELVAKGRMAVRDTFALPLMIQKLEALYASA